MSSREDLGPTGPRGHENYQGGSLDLYQPSGMEPGPELRSETERNITC